MAKSQPATDTNVATLSNDDNLKKVIVNCAKELAEIDAQRRKLNQQAADIRDTLKERGVVIDAFRDSYNYFKKRRHEKEGYDEYHKLCWDALNDADTGDLFAAA